MHIPTFKMPIVKQVWQFIQQGYCAFPIDLREAYVHIPIFKHHHCYFRLCLPTQTLSVEGFAYWAGYNPCGFHFTC